MAKGRKFTARERKFIQFYDGNGTEAAIKAGYTKNRKSAGVFATRLLAKAKIADAIQKRTDREARTVIATREQRQKLWTEMMFKAFKDSDRLRASELLGKSEGDFLDRHEVTGKDGGPIRGMMVPIEMSPEEALERAKGLARALKELGQDE